MLNNKKYLKTYRLSLIVILLFIAACKNEAKKTIQTDPIVFNKEGELTIFKAKTDSAITQLNIEIADTEYETQTGLMYRDALDTNNGMLFVFQDLAMHSFYMKNTKIPLDLIFIDDSLRIATIKANAQPLDKGSLSSEVPVRYVLEINAGLAEQWGVEVGDHVEFTRQ